MCSYWALVNLGRSFRCRNVIADPGVLDPSLQISFPLSLFGSFFLHTGSLFWYQDVRDAGFLLEVSE